LTSWARLVLLSLMLGVGVLASLGLNTFQRSASAKHRGDAKHICRDVLQRVPGGGDSGEAPAPPLDALKHVPTESIRIPSLKCIGHKGPHRPSPPPPPLRDPTPCRFLPQLSKIPTRERLCWQKRQIINLKQQDV